jgi:DNA-binding transcriptional ArsR family regulator
MWLPLAEDKLEEETYSLIFTSLKHPIRRRILRMLADKPLTFSEIQEQINIDSGHLSYHIENLGGLVMHNQNGDYNLSSIGVAAVRLMSGVEEHPSVYSNKKPKLPQVLSKVFSLVLATTLIVMSLHAITYTTPISTATLNQDNIYPTPFVIGAGETFEFNVTIQYWNYKSKYDDVTMIPYGNKIVLQTFYIGPFGPDEYTLSVEPPPNTLTAQAAGSMWLDFRLNTTSRTKNNTFILMPFGFPNDLLVDVYTPNENKSLGELDWTYGKIDHFTSPIVEVNQLGSYRFIMKNNDSSEWTGVLRPNVEWQIIEKPYFYYGIMGLVFATGYLVFMAYQILSKSQKNTKSTSILGD